MDTLNIIKGVSQRKLVEIKETLMYQTLKILTLIILSIDGVCIGIPSFKGGLISLLTNPEQNSVNAVLIT